METMTVKEMIDDTYEDLQICFRPYKKDLGYRWFRRQVREFLNNKDEQGCLSYLTEIADDLSSVIYRNELEEKVKEWIVKWNKLERKRMSNYVIAHRKKKYGK